MTPRTDPVADHAESVGRALLEFAEQLRAQPGSAAMDAPVAPKTVGPDRSKLGGTQQRVLAALEGAGEVGLTAAQVAEQVDIKPTNAPRTLKALRDRGLAAAVTGGPPTVWRALS